LVLGFEREPRLQRNIPLSRAFQLLPRIDFLDRIGAPIELGLERNKLPPGFRERPDMLLSTRAIAAFTGDMGHREGIEDFGWRTASPRLNQISPGLVRTLQRSPTLLNALQNLCGLAHRESSSLQMWLAERRGALLLCHRSPIALDSLGANELAMMRAAIMISIVRRFTAPDWAPTECGLAVGCEIGPLVQEELRDARIQRAPDYGWLRLPHSILARPPRTPVSVETRSGTEGGEEPAQDLVGSLAQALRPYLARKPPSVRDAADLAGTSVRSLQRGLAHAGSSYRDVLQRAKLDAARELLEQPDVKIFEVAYETGFSDPAHFTHFFRRLAGITPREYRATLPKA
jgi:AraC-like DNA-binding protein